MQFFCRCFSIRQGNCIDDAILLVSFEISKNHYYIYRGEESVEFDVFSKVDHADQILKGPQKIARVGTPEMA